MPSVRCHPPFFPEGRGEHVRQAIRGALRAQKPDALEDAGRGPGGSVADKPAVWALRDLETGAAAPADSAQFHAGARYVNQFRQAMLLSWELRQR